MKRIIDGITYNTDTSTRLATSDYETDYNHASRPCEGTLYQTRGGAYFVHEVISLEFDEDAQINVVKGRFKALSGVEAQEWIMTGEVEVIHNPFADPPEAEAEAEPGATMYIRVPASLKNRVDDAARGANLSTNALAIRCMENCLAHNRHIAMAIEAIEKSNEYVGGREKTNLIREALTILKEIRAL